MTLANLLPSGFKASTYTSASDAPRTNEPLPPGTYTVEITSAEVRPLKSGKGDGLTLEYTVIDPEKHAKRKVWQTLNIKHESKQAQDIALRDFASLCLAVGKDAPTEHDLFGCVLRIRTAIERQEGYDPRARVVGYESAGVPKKPAKAPSIADDADDIPY